MITYQTLQWSTVPQFIAGLFAVYAVAVAIFRSMPAEELKNVISKRSATLNRMRRLRWELNQNTTFTTAKATGDQFAAREPLTPDARQDRLVELDHLTSKTRLLRAFSYLMGCHLCQYAWSAMVLLLASCVTGTNLIFSVAMYAGVLGFLSALQTKPAVAGQPIKTCGG